MPVGWLRRLRGRLLLNNRPFRFLARLKAFSTGSLSKILLVKVVTNGPVQIPPNTDKLVVTIPEDLPLDEHENSLLAKGVNFIPRIELLYEIYKNCENS